MIRIKEVSQYKFLLFRYKRDNRRVYYVIIAEVRVSSHENFAKYVGAVVPRRFTSRYFQKFGKVHWKAPVPESLF